MRPGEFKSVKINKNIEVVKEKKSFFGSGSINGSGSFFDFLLDGGNFDLSIIQSIFLYEQVSPFFDAVDRIATAFSEIPFRIQNKKTGDYVDHPVLDLFAAPNADVSEAELKHQIMSFFLITGNQYLLATGNTKAPPKELWTVIPQAVTPLRMTQRAFGSVAGSYQVTTVDEGAFFFNAEDLMENGRSVIRYFDGDLREIWHTRQFNPRMNASNLLGMSKARPIMTELEQYASGNDNNLSLLKRGFRGSAAWVNNRGEELTDDQFERIKEQAQLYSGSDNAGGIPILDGMDVKEMGSNNREMQFKELQDQMIVRISHVYRIPLALLMDSTMTYANLETAQLQFYDLAVIPPARYVYAELTRFLMPRYKGSEDLVITCSPDDIDALRPRVLESAKKQNDLNVNTMNEIRTIIGDEKLSTGGDVILASAGVAPIGEDGFTEDNLDKPLPDSGANKSRFVKQMKLLTDRTDEEINTLWEDHK